MNTKKKYSNKVFTVLLLAFAAVMLWPDGRAYVQQGMMSLGFFKADLKAPQEPQQAAAAALAPVGATFTDMQGKAIRTQDLQGKVVFINFWATWCPPCRAEMPSIQVLYNKLKDNSDIVFLMVELDHEIEKAQAFLKKENLDLPIYFPEGSIPESWLGGSIPVTVILGKDGQIASRHEGMADYSTPEVFDFIQTLIHK